MGGVDFHGGGAPRAVFRRGDGAARIGLEGKLVHKNDVAEANLRGQSKNTAGSGGIGGVKGEVSLGTLWDILPGNRSFAHFFAIHGGHHGDRLDLAGCHLCDGKGTVFIYKLVIFQGSGGVQGDPRVEQFLRAGRLLQVQCLDSLLRTLCQNDLLKRQGLEEGVQFATLTDIIYKTWAGKTAKEYKQFKRLKKENLRDNMTNKELVLNMLAELSTKEISEVTETETFDDHMEVARRGANVAKEARMKLEEETGRPVVTPINAKDFLQLEQDKDDPQIEV